MVGSERTNRRTNTNVNTNAPVDKNERFYGDDASACKLELHIRQYRSRE